MTDEQARLLAASALLGRSVGADLAGFFEDTPGMRVTRFRLALKAVDELAHVVFLQPPGTLKGFEQPPDETPAVRHTTIVFKSAPPKPESDQ